MSNIIDFGAKAAIIFNTARKNRGVSMRGTILGGALYLLLAGCVAGEYNAPSHTRLYPGSSANQPYQITTSTEVARVGETSQRFEIRHGDCGRDYDCENDRQRIELAESDKTASARVGTARWYGWSIYLPPSFQDISPANTTIGQIKLTEWRNPLWNFNLTQGRLFFEYRPNAQHNTIGCYGPNIQQMRGRWTDVVVYANYAYDNTSSEPMMRVWINGRLLCSDNRPLVTQEMVTQAGYQQIRFRYGIYNSYVSRWLNANRTRSVITEGFNDYHTDSGGTNNSVTATPFDIDWGVELPTQVVFYDEVRIGRSREEVDVRMRHPN